MTQAEVVVIAYLSGWLSAIGIVFVFLRLQ